MSTARWKALLALRSAALLGLAALLTRLLARWCVAALVPVVHRLDAGGEAALSTLPFAQALTAIAALALLGCWLRLAGGAVLFAGTVVLRGRHGPGAGPAAPGLVAGPLVRRAVLAALGLSLPGAVLLPAHADPLGRPSAPGAAAVAPAALAGLQLPDRTTGARGPLGTVTVRAGDSLWSIAERLLPTGAGIRRVAAEWQRLREANASTLGRDADLIFPGTRLVVPPQGLSRKERQ